MYIVLPYIGSDIVQVVYQMKCKMLRYPVHIGQVQYILKKLCMWCSFTCVVIVCGLQLLACSAPVLVQCVSSVYFFLTFYTFYFSTLIMTLLTPFYNLQQIIKASKKQFYKSVSTLCIPVAARSKAWFCGPSLAGSNPARGEGFLSLESVACCQVQVQVQVSASG